MTLPLPIDTPLSRVKLATGVTLDVWDSGPREAPALIFLHGFPESHRTWRHQIAHFAGRFRCIAPDQRGYGRSDKPTDQADYRPELLVADVFALARALRIRSFTVLGHDWGGAIAWLVAAFGQATGIVTRAVIANAPHSSLFQRLLWLDPVQRAASQYIRLFRDPAHDAETRSAGLAPLLARAFPDDTRLPTMEPADRDAVHARWRDGEAALAMLNWYRASPVVVPSLAEPYRLPAEMPPALPPITIPTLVLWGEEDRALPTCNLEGLADAAPAATIRRLPGVGHFSPWQGAAQVNAALDEFLEPPG